MPPCFLFAVPLLAGALCHPLYKLPEDTDLKVRRLECGQREDHRPFRQTHRPDLKLLHAARMSSAPIPGSDGDLNRHVPSPSIFLNATVLDSSRTSVPLKDLFERSPRSVLAIIFIRHWYCAACQHYIEILSSRISLDDLAKQNAKLIVIGHGEPERIQAYKGRAVVCCLRWGVMFSTCCSFAPASPPRPIPIAEHTKCSFDVYTDPSKHLHKELGFVSHGGYDLLFRAGQPSYSDRGLAGELGAFVKVRPASLLFASERLDEPDAECYNLAMLRIWVQGVFSMGSAAGGGDVSLVGPVCPYASWPANTDASCPHFRSLVESTCSRSVSGLLLQSREVRGLSLVRG